MFTYSANAPGTALKPTVHFDQIMHRTTTLFILSVSLSNPRPVKPPPPFWIGFCAVTFYPQSAYCADRRKIQLKNKIGTYFCIITKLTINLATLLKRCRIVSIFNTSPNLRYVFDQLSSLNCAHKSQKYLRMSTYILEINKRDLQELKIILLSDFFLWPVWRPSILLCLFTFAFSSFFSNK